MCTFFYNPAIFQDNDSILHHQGIRAQFVKRNAADNEQIYQQSLDYEDGSVSADKIKQQGQCDQQCRQKRQDRDDINVIEGTMIFVGLGQVPVQDVSPFTASQAAYAMAVQWLRPENLKTAQRPRRL